MLDALAAIRQQHQQWTSGITATARDELRRYAGGKAWICHVPGYDNSWPKPRARATCKVDGEDVPQWMVRNGWALSFVRYSHAYDADQAGARSACGPLGRRIYRALGLASSRPIDRDPWCHKRADRRPEDPLERSISRRGAIARLRDKGQHQPARRVHLPCARRALAGVKMDLSNGKRWFCSPADAEAAGCRAAKN